MKKLFINSIITLILLTQLHGDSTTKSIKVNISNINATSDEIVYGSDGYKVSHLYWRLEDVKLLGITASFMPSKRIVINADFKKNIDNPTSTMDDYDWLDGYTPSSAGYTHWSHHEKTIVEEVMKIDLNIQARIIPTKIGILYGMIGYKKDTFKWVAWGGFTEYSQNNFNRVYLDNNEKSISYNQYIRTPYIGAGLVNMDLKNFKFDLNFKYGYNVKIKGEDTHHQRNDSVTGSSGTYTSNGIYFEDNTDGATLLEYSFSAAYNLIKNFTIFFTYTHSDFTIAKGKTTAYYLDTPYNSTSSYNNAGASHESTIYSMGIKYDF